MTEPDWTGFTIPVIDLRDHASPDDEVDALLLARVREGDDAAFGELWARHATKARRVAARLVPRADIEDLVSEAFERTLAAIRSGHGPQASFFPYVSRALRGRAATLLAAKARITLADDDTLDSPVEDADPFLGHPAKGRLVQAFQELPARWQDALWVSVVQDEPPRRAAAFLGTSPNGASALVIRARRRLRANFIDLSAAESRDPLCGSAIAAPSRHAEHISSCVHCEATLAGLAELDVSLRSRGLPIAALIGAGAARVVAPHRRLRDFLAAVPAKVAVAAVAVTAAGVTAGPYLLAPSADIRPTGTRPAAAGPVLADGPTGTEVAAVGPARPAPLISAAPAPAAPGPTAAAHSRPTSSRPDSPTARTTPARRTQRPDPPAPPPAHQRHVLTIAARADRACACARVTVTGVRRTDRVVVVTRQRGVTARRVTHPDHPGTLRLTVAGRPGRTVRLEVKVIVVRANGRTVRTAVTVRAAH